MKASKVWDGNRKIEFHSNVALDFSECNPDQFGDIHLVETPLSESIWKSLPLRALKPVARDLGPCSRKQPFTEFHMKALTGENLILGQGVLYNMCGTDSGVHLSFMLRPPKF